MLKVGKILYYHHAATGKWRIVLPTEKQQQAVIQEVHGYAEGHLKPWRMQEIISPKYYWRKLKDTLKQYHRNCEHCNRNDNSYRPALGYYSVWETPLAPAMAYAMDLITDLPPAGSQLTASLSSPIGTRDTQSPSPPTSHSLVKERHNYSSNMWCSYTEEDCRSASSLTETPGS